MDVITTFISYFLIFVVIHSVLATTYVKNKAEKLLGKEFRFYRSIYTVISVLTFAPVLIVWMEYTDATPVFYVVPQWLHPVFILFRLLASGLLIYSAYQTDILEFLGVRQIQGKTSNKLITGGAYRIVRHPLYTGGIILLFTKMNMSLLDITAVMFISVYLIIGAFIEEKRMIMVFGDEYRKYQHQVSMFIPVKWFVKKISPVIP